MADSNPLGSPVPFYAFSSSPTLSSPSYSATSNTVSSKYSRTKRHWKTWKRNIYEYSVDTDALNGRSVPTFTTSLVNVFSTSSLSTQTPDPFITTTTTATTQASKIPNLSMPNENSGEDTNVDQQFENGGSTNPTEDETLIKEEMDDHDMGHESLTGPTLSIIPISRILEGIPQNPHFLQLRSFSEIVRRNLISGWYKTFEDTVEQIQALRKEDFWVRASELWKTIEGLQSVGFNVVALRRRVVEMCDVMMELKECELEIKALKEKAEMHRMEKTRLESVILCVRARADKEQGNMEQTLCQADKIQQALPRYDDLLAKMAMESIVV